MVAKLKPGMMNNSSYLVWPHCSDDKALDTDAEGTQSFGTCQSISVLHDLELPPQDHHQEDEDATFNEEIEDNEKTKEDAFWAEPIPKNQEVVSRCQSHKNYTQMFHTNRGVVSRLMTRSVRKVTSFLLHHPSNLFLNRFSVLMLGHL
ncbi:hypothetical protein OS493_032310 [Desmophyllum pertusum]|uniref:Uncharacterized protein n=1 Tax=Desmophyllum pertusum TaxID=174260 RepID=A0A9W9YW18_9CNID|nr:hypothetical protein OS493_032310 [Desmophyllum pertusum]